MYTYRIWDKVSPINNCPADEAIKSLGVKDTEQLCILSQGGLDCITQTFPASATETEVKAWVDALNAEVAAQQAATEAAANQPTLEDRVKALEAAQLAALGV